MKCAVGVCGHCQFGPCFVCKDGPVFRYDRIAALLRHAGGVRWPAKPKLAVFKFASCDGCQLSPARLRGRAAGGGRARSRSPTSSRPRARSSKGPYDLALVEGSITTPHDAERIQQVRKQSQLPGHDRRLRHRRRHPGPAQLQGRAASSPRAVYATPEYISTLGDLDADRRSTCGSTSSCAAARSTRRQLLEVLGAFLRGRRPNIPTYSVCLECKRRGHRLRDGRARHALPRAR